METTLEGKGKGGGERERREGGANRKSRKTARTAPSAVGRARWGCRRRRRLRLPPAFVPPFFLRIARRNLAKKEDSRC